MQLCLVVFAFDVSGAEPGSIATAPVRQAAALLKS